MATSSKWVLFTLPDGSEFAVQGWRTDTERQLRGVALVEGSTVAPLHVITAAEVEALECILDLAEINYARQEVGMVRAKEFEAVRQLLSKLKEAQ